MVTLDGSGAGTLWRRVVGSLLDIGLNAEMVCLSEKTQDLGTKSQLNDLALTSPPRVNSLAQHLLFSRLGVICWPENQPLETSSLDFLHLIFLDQTSNVSG